MNQKSPSLTLKPTPSSTGDSRELLPLVSLMVRYSNRNGEVIDLWFTGPHAKLGHMMALSSLIMAENSTLSRIYWQHRADAYGVSLSFVSEEELSKCGTDSRNCATATRYSPLLSALMIRGRSITSFLKMGLDTAIGVLFLTICLVIAVLSMHWLLLSLLPRITAPDRRFRRDAIRQKTRNHL